MSRATLEALSREEVNARLSAPPRERAAFVAEAAKTGLAEATA